MLPATMPLFAASRLFVSGECQLEAAALDLAKIIATKSPIAVLGTEHLLLHARDHGVQENLDYTQAWNSAMLQTDVRCTYHFHNA